MTPITWIPCDRILPIVARHPSPRQRLEGTSGEKRLRDMRGGTQQFVSLDVADLILTRLNLHHWFHIPREHGGLADIYEDGAQYGKPDRSHTRSPRLTNRKYATEEERRQARLETWRRSYQKKKAAA